MSRVFLITLGYCPSRMFQHTARQACETLSGDYDIRKLFIAKPYPIDTENNLRLNHQVCRKFGYEFIKREVDSGAAQDFNQTLVDVGLQKDDVVICYDHDAYPITWGWDAIAIKYLEQYKNIDWVVMWNDGTAREFRDKGYGYELEEVLQATSSMTAGVSIFRGDFLLATGGLVQPCPYYGGVEEAMWLKLQERGTDLVFLKGHWEDQRLKYFEDKEYRDWKWAHTAGKFTGKFSEYLQSIKS